MAKTDLTAARLRELFHYDPETGVFTNLTQRGRNVKPQAVAGSKDRGYLRVAVDGERYLVHRLVWLYVHGVWPIGLIDHKNGDGTDNRIDNIRQVTHSENAQNQRKARSDNTSGLMGVTARSNNKWRALITHNGKQTRLGDFDTKEAAHAAYIATKRVLHPACTI